MNRKYVALGFVALAAAFYLVAANATVRPFADPGPGDPGPGDPAPDNLPAPEAESVMETLADLFARLAVPSEYESLILASEREYGLPAGLLARVLWQESRFRPDIISGKVKSSAGALGIAQFMPSTAMELGVDPLDPRQAIPGAARYLFKLYRRTGSWREAVAAYNWGIGNVQRKGIASAPQETIDYLASVFS